jgi:hypothetical protein
VRGAARHALLAVAIAALAIACGAQLVPEICARWRFHEWRSFVLEHHTVSGSVETDLPDWNPRELALLARAAITDEDQVADAAAIELVKGLMTGLPGASEALGRVAREATSDARRASIIAFLCGAGDAGFAEAERILFEAARSADATRRRFAVLTLARLVGDEPDDARRARTRSLLERLLATADVDPETRAEAAAILSKDAPR